jgi:methylase of polypeptide subunit release factors
MSDLELLASAEAAAFAAVLRELLRELHFDQVNHDLRLPEFGGDYLIRPFPLPGSPVDVSDIKARLRHVVKSSADDGDRRFAKRIQLAFRFLMFGEPIDRKALADLFGAERRKWIEVAMSVGLFVADGPNQTRMNGLSICSRRLPGVDGLYLLADTPPHFKTRSGPLRVYAGADSYELMLRVSAGDAIRGYAVEMGSGSGIQLIAALKKRPAIVKAIGVERDRRAMHVSLFNAALNQAAERFAVVSDVEQLRKLLGRHEVAFGMSNPPFLAVPASVRVDEQSRTLLSNVSEIRDTPDGALVDVEAAFPQAGWGGQDGLDLTRQFIDVFRSVGASKVIIYSQFAGDERGPSLIQKHVERTGDCEFAFEPVKSGGGMQKKPVYTAGESALTVARLLTAVLLEKQEPQRLRLVVREGGPEHRLMRDLAAQIEASYRRLGISHFHDGFVHLVRRA